jgi:hypothetical protein
MQTSFTATKNHRYYDRNGLIPSGPQTPHDEYVSLNLTGNWDTQFSGN